MFNLVIYKQDNSVYWSEYFESESDLHKWLQLEMTRDYWKSSFRYQIIDNYPTQEQIEAEITSENQKKLQKKTQRNAIRGIKNASNITQLKVALIELIKYLEIGEENE